MRVGHLGRRLLHAYQASVAGAAGSGCNVLVDEVVIDRTTWREWGDALVGLDVVWVGIRCAAEVAEERNRRRGDGHRPGLAASLSVAVHRDAAYDFEIDTTTLAPVDALAALSRGLGIHPAQS